jgi:capsular exopolysaccharide synthesis family protein
VTFAALLNTLLVRQRAILVAVFAAAFGIAVAAAFLLPKQYSATASLSITGSGNPQADQAQAAVYQHLLGSAPVRNLAASRLGVPPSELQGKVSFAVEPGAPLITVTARDRKAAQSARIANAYAAAFVTNRLDATRATARNRQKQLQDTISATQRQLRRLRGLAREAAQTHLTVARQAYQNAVRNAAFTITDVSLGAPAGTPTAPAKPRPLLYLLGGAVAALFLAIAAALGADALDKRVRDDSELEEILDAPVLARVPRGKGKDDAALRQSFEFLRTNLEFADGRDRSPRTLAITSCAPGAGKTFVTSALSRAFATSDGQVVAVDADLHRPALRSAFAVDSEQGVAEALANSSDPSPYLATTSSGVTVLPAGKIETEPSLLFKSERFSGMLRSLGERSTHVFVDTPPVLAGPETSVIGALVDGVVLVVDFNEARRDELIAARQQLSRTGARVVGVVVNRAPRRRGGAHGYY